ncbi:hypothetical protein, partial [Nocardioides ginsengisoli]|uniref:hypothetical protein n=1 Tax=Nocardioides ginsengisoli TaxID=363868 RepID=UPI00349E78FC
AAVGYAVLALGGDQADPDTGTLRGEDPADPVQPFDVPPAPVVTKSGKGTRWTFRWALEEPREGDEFKVELSGDGVTQAAPEYTTATSKTLTVAPADTVCVQVSVSRKGSPPSAASRQVCVVGQ